MKTGKRQFLSVCVLRVSRSKNSCLKFEVEVRMTGHKGAVSKSPKDKKMRVPSHPFCFSTCESHGGSSRVGQSDDEK